MELKSTNRLAYMQLLETWLNQRNYEQHYEEAIKTIVVQDTTKYDQI
jgi:hypothetical protein